MIRILFKLMSNRQVSTRGWRRGGLVFAAALALREPRFRRNYVVNAPLTDSPAEYKRHAMKNLGQMQPQVI